MNGQQSTVNGIASANAANFEPSALVSMPRSTLAANSGRLEFGQPQTDQPTSIEPSATDTDAPPMRTSATALSRFSTDANNALGRPISTP